MKKVCLTTLLIAMMLNVAFAQQKQKEEEKEKQFTLVTEVKTTPVKNQERTGTCWCFATNSFIETELLRMGAPEIDLSEMYIVRKAYTHKAKQYFKKHGKGNYSEGGQTHDAIKMVKQYGFVPESAYLGRRYGGKYHIHREMVSSTKAMLNSIIKNPNKTISPIWLESINSVLDTYMGKVPEKFTYKGKEYTPVEFVKELKFNPDDYIELTSYKEYPFYQKVDLIIPDNWTDDAYYNVPIEDLMAIMNHALNNGYSVCWDGDVSEKGFSHRKGYAVLEDEDGDINDDMRQNTFDNFKTTDDHLMHLTGIVKDETGKLYYKTKNSWSAKSNKFGGYLNMSAPYVRLKTVAIMVHKDAIPKAIRRKLKL